MAWFLPVLFSFSMFGAAVLFWIVPPEMQNGDPMMGILIAAASLLGGQGFVLWLLSRWAREQDTGER
ncbi:hypothetical protein ELI_01145 [Erythrobacter litoralis HTCC2594]|uniref:Uncharacterized protein n=2 Tax=Erythrobacter litoralis TaxID=39960 RepID=Q2NDC0_ERYLH|nr:hypothetical protein ELI_01145 [Erythrobacter litoralis HTCC2594]